MFFGYKGIKIYYDISGQGTDLLLLHGWGCTHGIFSAFMPSFEVSHRVIALDFPGFGLSDEPREVWGVEDYTQMLEALCAHLDIRKPSIVCHSFGGRVAILFASRNAVGRMIFADAAGVKPRRGMKYHLKVWSYKCAKWWLSKVLRDPVRLEAYRASKGSSDYRNASPMMKAILSKVVNEDLTGCLSCISSPVLLFWGENDTATPIRDAHIMEKLIPDAGLVVVRGGSHFSFLDNPALFRSMIDTFLV